MNPDNKTFEKFCKTNVKHLEANRRIRKPARSRASVHNNFSRHVAQRAHNNPESLA